MDEHHYFRYRYDFRPESAQPWGETVPSIPRVPADLRPWHSLTYHQYRELFSPCPPLKKRRLFSPSPPLKLRDPDKTDLPWWHSRRTFQKYWDQISRSPPKKKRKPVETENTLHLKPSTESIPEYISPKRQKLKQTLRADREWKKRVRRGPIAAAYRRKKGLASDVGMPEAAWSAEGGLRTFRVWWCANFEEQQRRLAKDYKTRGKRLVHGRGPLHQSQSADETPQEHDTTPAHETPQALEAAERIIGYLYFVGIPPGPVHDAFEAALSSDLACWQLVTAAESEKDETSEVDATEDESSEDDATEDESSEDDGSSIGNTASTEVENPSC